eukprot:Pgem_evm1s16712
MNIPITKEFDHGDFLTYQSYREYIADPNRPEKITNVNGYVFYVEVKYYENVVTATITETLIDGIASNRTVYTTAHVQHINHSHTDWQCFCAAITTKATAILENQQTGFLFQRIEMLLMVS